MSWPSDPSRILASDVGERADGRLWQPKLGLDGLEDDHRALAVGLGLELASSR